MGARLGVVMFPLSAAASLRSLPAVARASLSAAAVLVLVSQSSCGPRAAEGASDEPEQVQSRGAGQVSRPLAS
jgi:hypothetical protein